MHARQETGYGFTKQDCKLSEAGTRKLLPFLKGVGTCRFLRSVYVRMYVCAYICTYVVTTGFSQVPAIVQCAKLKGTNGNVTRKQVGKRM